MNISRSELVVSDHGKAYCCDHAVCVCDALRNAGRPAREHVRDHRVQIRRRPLSDLLVVQQLRKQRHFQPQRGQFLLRLHVHAVEEADLSDAELVLGEEVQEVLAHVFCREDKSSLCNFENMTKSFSS